MLRMRRAGRGECVIAQQPQRRDVITTACADGGALNFVGVQHDVKQVSRDPPAANKHGSNKA